MIDTHAHIYADQFDQDRLQIIEQAKAVGLNKILLPNIDMSSVEAMFDLTREYAGFLYPMVGLHPCSVDYNYKQQLSKLEAYLHRDEVIAIGEIGVDLYWDKSTKDIQLEAFDAQCTWAVKHSLPIVIHSRDSIDLIIEFLEKNYHGKLQGVFHCFTGTKEQAKRIMDLGFYVGIGGVLTFKNSDLKEVIPHIPLDRILIETDSPYLAPMPYRGKRNEPSFLKEVLEFLANVLQMDQGELDQQLESNSLRLFKI